MQTQTRVNAWSCLRSLFCPCLFCPAPLGKGPGLGPSLCQPHSSCHNTPNSRRFQPGPGSSSPENNRSQHAQAEAEPRACSASRGGRTLSKHRNRAVKPTDPSHANEGRQPKTEQQLLAWVTINLYLRETVEIQVGDSGNGMSTRTQTVRERITPGRRQAGGGEPG